MDDDERLYGVPQRTRGGFAVQTRKVVRPKSDMHRRVIPEKAVDVHGGAVGAVTTDTGRHRATIPRRVRMPASASSSFVVDTSVVSALSSTSSADPADAGKATRKGGRRSRRRKKGSAAEQRPAVDEGQRLYNNAQVRDALEATLQRVFEHQQYEADLRASIPRYPRNRAIMFDPASTGELRPAQPDPRHNPATGSIRLDPNTNTDTTTTTTTAGATLAVNPTPVSTRPHRRTGKTKAEMRQRHPAAAVRLLMDQIRFHEHLQNYRCPDPAMRRAVASDPLWESVGDGPWQWHVDVIVPANPIAQGTVAGASDEWVWRCLMVDDTLKHALTAHGQEGLVQWKTFTAQSAIECIRSLRIFLRVTNSPHCGCDTELLGEEMIRLNKALADRPVAVTDGRPDSPDSATDGVGVVIEEQSPEKAKVRLEPTPRRGPRPGTVGDVDAWGGRESRPGTVFPMTASHSLQTEEGEFGRPGTASSVVPPLDMDSLRSVPAETPAPKPEPAEPTPKANIDTTHTHSHTDDTGAPTTAQRRNVGAGVLRPKPDPGVPIAGTALDFDPWEGTVDLNAGVFAPAHYSLNGFRLDPNPPPPPLPPTSSVTGTTHPPTQPPPTLPVPADTDSPSRFPRAVEHVRRPLSPPVVGVSNNTINNTTTHTNNASDATHSADSPLDVTQPSIASSLASHTESLGSTLALERLDDADAGSVSRQNSQFLEGEWEVDPPRSHPPVARTHLPGASLQQHLRRPALNVVRTVQPGGTHIKPVVLARMKGRNVATYKHISRMVVDPITQDLLARTGTKKAAILDTDRDDWWFDDEHGNDSRTDSSRRMGSHVANPGSTLDQSQSQSQSQSKSHSSSKPGSAKSMPRRPGTKGSERRASVGSWKVEDHTIDGMPRRPSYPTGTPSATPLPLDRPADADVGDSPPQLPQGDVQNETETKLDTDEGQGGQEHDPPALPPQPPPLTVDVPIDSTDVGGDGDRDHDPNPHSAGGVHFEASTVAVAATTPKALDGPLLSRLADSTRPHSHPKPRDRTSTGVALPVTTADLGIGYRPEDTVGSGPPLMKARRLPIVPPDSTLTWSDWSNRQLAGTYSEPRRSGTGHRDGAVQRHRHTDSGRQQAVAVMMHATDMSPPPSPSHAARPHTDGRLSSMSSSLHGSLGGFSRSVELADATIPTQGDHGGVEYAPATTVGRALTATAFHHRVPSRGPMAMPQPLDTETLSDEGSSDSDDELRPTTPGLSVRIRIRQPSPSSKGASSTASPHKRLGEFDDVHDGVGDAFNDVATWHSPSADDDVALFDQLQEHLSFHRAQARGGRGRGRRRRSRRGVARRSPSKSSSPSRRRQSPRVDGDTAAGGNDAPGPSAGLSVTVSPPPSSSRLSSTRKSVDASFALSRLGGSSSQLSPSPSASPSPTAVRSSGSPPVVPSTITNSPGMATHHVEIRQCSLPSPIRALTEAKGLRSPDTPPDTVLLTSPKAGSGPLSPGRSVSVHSLHDPSVGGTTEYSSTQGGDGSLSGSLSMSVSMNSQVLREQLDLLASVDSHALGQSLLHSMSDSRYDELPGMAAPPRRRAPFLGTGVWGGAGADFTNVNNNNNSNNNRPGSAGLATTQLVLASGESSPSGTKTGGSKRGRLSSTMRRAGARVVGGKLAAYSGGMDYSMPSRLNPNAVKQYANTLLNKSWSASGKL